MGRHCLSGFETLLLSTSTHSQTPEPHWWAEEPLFLCHGVSLGDFFSHLIPFHACHIKGLFKKETVSNTTWTCYREPGRLLLTSMPSY